MRKSFEYSILIWVQWMCIIYIRSFINFLLAFSNSLFIQDVLLLNKWSIDWASFSSCNLLNEWIILAFARCIGFAHAIHFIEVKSIRRVFEICWSFFSFPTASSRFEHIFTAVEISNLRNQAIWIMNNSIRSIILSFFYLSSSQNQNSLVCLPLLNTAQNIVFFLRRRGSWNAQPGTNEWGREREREREFICLRLSTRIERQNSLMGLRWLLITLSFQK